LKPGMTIALPFNRFQQLKDMKPGSRLAASTSF